MNTQTIVEALLKDESKLEKFLSDLTQEEKKSLLSELVTTPSASLNRLACVSMSELVQDSSNNMHILKNLLSPYSNVPSDTFKALRENGYVFALSMPIIDTIIANSNWGTLDDLLPELLAIESKERKELADKIFSLLPDDEAGKKQCHVIVDALNSDL